MSTLQRGAPAGYTPNHLVDKILTSRASMEGELKQVTVLFCDISGSTPLAQRLGPEGMHALLNSFFQRALAEVHRFEGTINQFLGDGFMALFGAPIAHEDHARRALAGACAIRRELHADEYDAHTGRLPIRIGLNTGHVVVGKIGDNLRMDYTANGDTTHLAARLNHMAASGEILASASTHSASRQEFHFRSLGERRIRGITHPVRVFSLLDEREGTTRSQGGQARSPLIGRQRELAQLTGCLERLRNGRGGIVAIVGEPGIGKSRLTREMRAASSSDVLWLEGCALSFGQNISYGPFIEALRAALPEPVSHPGEISWEYAEQFLRDHLRADPMVHLPYFGILLGLQLPSVARSLIARQDPLDVRGQIFITARRLIEALCRKRPLVLMFDDWQWADDASEDLLEHIVPLASSSALLLVVAGRPDSGSAVTRLRETARLAPAGSYEEVVVHPLSEGAASQFVDHLLDVDQLPNAVSGMILRKAEGNPLFLEEIARSLHDMGVLRTDPQNGRMRLSPDLHVMHLPDRIETLIMARIDRLEDDVKHVLRLASVIGRSFYQRILARLDEAEEALDRNLSHLQELEFIRQQRQIPEVEYVFKHTLVQEASYRSILEDRRRQLHHRVGSVIESMFPDKLSEFAAVLAYHYVRAQEWDKAHHYLLLAGDQAGAIAADAEALSHYQTAMEVYAKAHGDSWDPLERAVLERKIGEAHLRMGAQEQASEHFERSLRLLGYNPPANRLAIAGAVAWHGGRLLLAGRSEGRPPERRRPMTPRDGERLNSLVALVWVDFYLDEWRFLLHVQMALSWSERLDRAQKWTSQACSGLSLAMQVAGFRRLAWRYAHRALAEAEQSGDLGAQATAALALGVHEMIDGNWNESIRQMTSSAESFRAQTRLRERVTVLSPLIWLLIQQGRFHEARTLLADLTTYAAESGDPIARAYGRCYQAMFDAFDGHLMQAMEDYQLGIAGLVAILDWQTVCGASGDGVQCALWAGAMGEAKRLISECGQTIAGKRILGVNQLSLLVAKADLALAQCRNDEGKVDSLALPHLNDCIKSLKRLASRSPCASIQAVFYEGCSKVLAGHEQEGAESMSVAIARAEQAGTSYVAAEMKLLGGSLLKTEQWLRDAVDAFRSMGAPFRLARALRVLGELRALSDPEQANALLRESGELLRGMQAGHEAALVDRALAGIAR